MVSYYGTFGIESGLNEILSFLLSSLLLFALLLRAL